MGTRKKTPKSITQKFEVLKDFNHGLKEYKKGNSIELKSQKGIEFLQNKKII